MIEAIRAYIKTIAEFLFFVMVIRLVSTEKSRKYINFASGIILLLISFGPVIDIISGGETYARDFLNNSLPSYDTTEQYAQNDTFDMVFQNELEQSVKEDVQSMGFEWAAAASMGPPVCRSSAPTCPLTNALTVWTIIRTRTSFYMSAAGKRIKLNYIR